MKKHLFSAVLLSAIIMLTCVAPISAVAGDVPVLKSISFDNAEIEGGFNQSIHDYNLILAENGSTPSLSDYEIEGDGELFVKYVCDSTNHQIAITAELKYDSGSSIYNFSFTGKSVELSSDNTLSDIYCPNCELDTKVTEGDYSYKLYIPKDLTQLSITPVTNDINAYCPPVVLSLTQAQEPEITLTCTATDGSQREYKIKIQRVDKTLAEVKKEMASDDYKTIVEGTRFYQQSEFLMLCACLAFGLLLFMVIFTVVKRKAVNPYDRDEKPFYKSSDNED